MSGHFQHEGRALLANGYLIVPIKPGEKRPALAGWQKARITPADLSHYKGHGVGVLCGQGAHPVVGVDIDISHRTIGPAIIAWCQQHLGVGCERIGAAPRILLAYRALDAGWTKGNSVTFYDPLDPIKPNGKRNDQQIEVLGFGQQFVAYHEHPDTHRPYEWVDFLGGLTSVHASELPIITEDQIEALLAEMLRVVRATPGIEIVTGTDVAPRAVGGDDDDWFANLSPKADVTLEQAKAMLAHLDNTLGFDYDMWVRVGMALHHEFDGSDDAYDVWVEWSETSPKHELETCAFKWPSFGKSSLTPTTMRWIIKIAHQAERDAEMEKRRGAIDEIKKLIAAAADSTELTTQVAAKVKPLMPEDGSALRAEVMGLFQRRFHALSGVALPVAEARKLLLDKMPTVRQRRPLTEFGNAERMLDRYGDGLMYVPEIATWFTWTGIYWRKASDIAIEHYAKETVRALADEVNDHPEPGEFYHFCALSQQAKMVRNMVALAASDPRVYVPAAELDKHPHLLGAPNGVIDVKRGVLMPPDPELRITRVVSCEYKPRTRCPLFMKVLHDVFNDEPDMVDFFHRLIGYSALGEPTQDVMAIPFGNGSNGKSTVLGAIRKAFGGYARAAEAATFVGDGRTVNAGGPREDLVRLRGARFVYVNEPDENGELREGSVKAMTGGDAINARGILAKDSIEIAPTWLIVMPTNHKPIIKGSDNGIWRRLVLIPFTRNFENDPSIKKDPLLGEKLELEAEGILAWIISGAGAYLARGLSQPAGVREARDQYRSQMDLLAEWLDDCCDLHPTYSEQSNVLWASWERFAKERGILNYVKSSIALGRRLDARFPQTRTERARMRLGIRVRPISSDFDDFFA